MKHDPKDMYDAMRGSMATKRRLVKPAREGNTILVMAALTEMSMSLATMQEALPRLIIELLANKEK